MIEIRFQHDETPPDENKPITCDCCPHVRTADGRLWKACLKDRFSAAGHLSDAVRLSKARRQRDLAGGALSTIRGLRSRSDAASVFDLDRSEAGDELIHPRGALQAYGSGFRFWAPSLYGHWCRPETRRWLIASRYNLSRSVHRPVGESRRAFSYSPFGSAASYTRRT